MPGAGLKIINKRIRSVKSTQQITKAMKMVAAAKLQRSQGRMLAARPYSRKLTDLLEQLASASGSGADDQTTHPLFEVRPVQRRLVVIITSDKGLCGGYNMNIMRLAHQVVDASQAEGVETEVYTIGKKVTSYFKRRGYKIFAEHIDFGGEVSAGRAKDVGERIVGSFLNRSFDEVRLIYSQFVSTVRQVPVNQQMLPIAAAGDGAADQEESDPQAAKKGGTRDYIWEPDQETLYRLLLPLYLNNRIFMTLSEAFTSEHAARMTSMAAATQNAGELIEALTMKRNRERQAAITAELSDIVGGANAL